MVEFIKDAIKLVCSIVIMLASLYLGLLFLTTIITILMSFKLLGFTFLVIAFSFMAGCFYNLVDKL